MKPFPKLLLWLSVFIPVVIAVLLIFFIEHPASVQTPELLANSTPKSQTTPSQKTTATQDNRQEIIDTEPTMQQLPNDNPPTISPEAAKTEETKIYFLSTRATADTGKSDIAKRAFSIPPGWRVQSIEETSRKGRARIVESDGVIFAEAHALSRMDGPRDEAYITVQITLIKE